VSNDELIDALRSSAGHVGNSPPPEVEDLLQLSRSRRRRFAAGTGVGAAAIVTAGIATYVMQAGPSTDSPHVEDPAAATSSQSYPSPTPTSTPVLQKLECKENIEDGDIDAWNPSRGQASPEGAAKRLGRDHADWQFTTIFVSEVAGIVDVRGVQSRLVGRIQVAPTGLGGWAVTSYEFCSEVDLF